MSEWIRVTSRRKPKDQQRVWCSFIERGDKTKYQFSDALIWWRDEAGFGRWTRTDCTLLEKMYEVTHWTPLLDPPKL
jgi:hypothetical protein